MLGETSGIIDTCMMPAWKSDNEVNEWFPEPWRSKRRLPAMLRNMYPAPTGIAPYGEFLDEARGPDDSFPGSDPGKIIGRMDADGVSQAVLMPQTRGPQPDIDMGTVLCAATNKWLAAQWLGKEGMQDRFLGTIRVNAEDPSAAVEEIETWAAHPKMVQIGIPLDARRPYGQRNYFPIWEAAAKYHMPVAIHSDGSASANYAPTMVGYPRKYIDFTSQESINYIHHVASFIMEGVFERLPDLKILLADGGHDMAMTLMWRMDIDFPISRHEVPWMTMPPSGYLRPHLRFRTARMEGPPPGPRRVEWLKASEAADLLVYGSNYPHWTAMHPQDVFPDLTEAQQQQVLRGNALELYAARLAQTPVRA